MERKIKAKIVGMIGLSSVLILIISLSIFGVLNQNFNFLQDFISVLGARDQPYALYWNLFGFVLVGIIYFIFGIYYGRMLEDKLLAFLLSMFGIGFALTAVPIDMDNARSSISKVHIVFICLGLAFWMFGLSRMGYNTNLPKTIRNRANIFALLLVSCMVGFGIGLWSMPVTHRMVFGIVFGWTTITSVELILRKKIAYGSNRRKAIN